MTLYYIVIVIVIIIVAIIAKDLIYQTNIKNIKKKILKPTFHIKHFLYEMITIHRVFRNLYNIIVNLVII